MTVACRLGTEAIRDNADWRMAKSALRREPLGKDQSSLLHMEHDSMSAGLNDALKRIAEDGVEPVEYDQLSDLSPTIDVFRNSLV